MNRRNFLAFSGPSIATMVLLMSAPLVMTLYLSMNRFNFRGDLRWVGFDNYLDIQSIEIRLNWLSVYC